jgi:hypothetical protein
LNKKQGILNDEFFKDALNTEQGILNDEFFKEALSIEYRILIVDEKNAE